MDRQASEAAGVHMAGGAFRGPSQLHKDLCALAWHTEDSHSNTREPRHKSSQQLVTHGYTCVFTCTETERLAGTQEPKCRWHTHCTRRHILYTHRQKLILLLSWPDGCLSNCTVITEPLASPNRAQGPSHTPASLQNTSQVTGLEFMPRFLFHLKVSCCPQCS